MCLACNAGRKIAHGKPGGKKPWLAERNRSPEHIALVTKHGVSGHPLYETWHAMMARCNNPNARSFKNYGGRGITVWEPWQDAAAFIEWVEQTLGPRPAGHTLDRIDNDNGYEPGNVRWATHSEQARNRRPETHAHGSAKVEARLTEDIVRECRRRWVAGEQQILLAIEFGVSKPTMHKALVGKTWQHVTA